MVIMRKKTVSFVLLFLILVGSCFAQEVVEKPDSKEFEQFDFANGLFERTLYDMAITEYKKYQDSYPEGQFNQEVLFGLAESYYYDDDYEHAVEYFTAYLQAFPQEKSVSIANLRLGQSYFFMEKYKNALASLNAINRGDLDATYHSMLDYYLGRTLFRLGDLGQAIKYFSVVTRATDKDAPIAYSYFFLGDIFVKQQQYDDAILNYSLSMENSREEKIVSLALFRKGEAEFEASKYEDSQKTFKAVIERYGHLPLVMDAFKNLLMVEYKQGRFEDVVADFNAFVEGKRVEGLAFNTYLIVADAYINLKDFVGALKIIADVPQGLQLGPDQLVQLYLKKVEILFVVGRFEEALEVLLTSLNNAKINQDQIVFLRAEAYFKLKDWEKARVHYQEIIDRFPQSAFIDEARWSLPLIDNQTGASEQAIAAFLKYYEEGADDLKRENALYDVILLEVKIERWGEATKHAGLFINQFMQSEKMERVAYLLGNLYQKLNRHEQAAAVFNEYIKNVKQSDRLHEVYFLRGFSLQSMDKKKEALEAYAFVLDSQTKNTFYYSALKNSASIYLSLGEDASASTMFEHVVLEFDDHDLNTTTILWLVDFLSKQKQHDRVVAILNRIEKKNDVQYDQATLAFYKAESYRGLGDSAGSIVSYERCIALDSEGELVGASRLGKGAALFEQKEFDQAQILLRQIIDDYPDDHALLIEARMLLAQIEESKGNLDQAIKDYMLVAILYQDVNLVPKALSRSAALFEQQGNISQALSTYQEIVSRFKQSPENEEAIKKIELLREK